MHDATVTVRRLVSRLRRDSTGPSDRVAMPHRPGLRIARRVVAALRAELEGATRSAHLPPGQMPAAHPARTPAALLRRLEFPEHLVPVLVAVLLLIASVSAVPGLARDATGGTDGAGTAPRIVVGGDTGPNVAADALNADSGVDMAFGESPAGPASGQEDTSASPDTAGQFLSDGTLLKPVAVDTTIDDGRSQLRSYTVRSGDTLTGIASRIGVSMMTIWWANKLTSKDDLKVGQVLVIPPVDGLVVTVGAGDTLASIASENHAEGSEILSVNGLTDQTLVIGQVLIIPGARGAAIPTPTPTKRPVVKVATVTRPTTTIRTSKGTTSKPPAQYTGGAFAWPVAGGYISQYFHSGHPALDIAADYGTAVKAAAAGTVIFAGWKNNGGGYQVWISHGSGLSTTYNHMSSVAVSVGSHVGKGALIGRIGATGNATGPHLHFEVWRGPVWDGGTRVNPLSYL